MIYFVLFHLLLLPLFFLYHFYFLSSPAPFEPLGTIYIISFYICYSNGFAKLFPVKRLWRTSLPISSLFEGRVVNCSLHIAHCKHRLHQEGRPCGRPADRLSVFLLCEHCMIDCRYMKRMGKLNVGPSDFHFVILFVHKLDLFLKCVSNIVNDL